MKPLLPALACIVLAACSAPEAGPRTGAPAPRFEAEYLDGSVRRFPDDYAGRPVILDFWAEWCRYCPDSMQRIDRARREHAATGIEVVAVNVGQDRAIAAAFIDRLGVGYSAVLDPAHTIAGRYGVRDLPVTFFIDPTGRIGGRILGGGDDKALAAQLARILPDEARDRAR